MQHQAEFVRSQFAAIQAQAKEFSGLAQSAMQQGAERAKSAMQQGADEARKAMEQGQDAAKQTAQNAQDAADARVALTTIRDGAKLCGPPPVVRGRAVSFSPVLPPRSALRTGTIPRRVKGLRMRLTVTGRPATASRSACAPSAPGTRRRAARLTAARAQYGRCAARLRRAGLRAGLPSAAPADREREPVGFNCDAVQQGLSGPKPFSCPLPGPRPLGVRCFCDLPIASFSPPQTAVGRVVP